MNEIKKGDRFLNGKDINGKDIIETIYDIYGELVFFSTCGDTGIRISHKNCFREQVKLNN